MHLANEFGLTALASVSFSRPPQLEFVAAANLFWMFFLYICMIWPVFVWLTEGRSARDLTQAATSKKKTSAVHHFAALVRMLDLLLHLHPTVAKAPRWCMCLPVLILLCLLKRSHFWGAPHQNKTQNNTKKDTWQFTEMPLRAKRGFVRDCSEFCPVKEQFVLSSVRQAGRQLQSPIPHDQNCAHEKSRFFFARSCLGKVPGRAPFSQLSKRATACTIRMQIVKQINENELDIRKRINQLGQLISN